MTVYGAAAAMGGRREAFPADDRRSFREERGREIGSPAVATIPTSRPNTADLERFFETAHRFGYWLGGPVDNAAVGIALDGSKRNTIAMAANRTSPMMCSPP